jgi:molybdate-binding protein/DNA-binding XRE family transcriptional regulator
MTPERRLTNRVRACRVARGWSQDELATRAGVSRAGVSAIETGRLAPSTVAALALAAALDCRVEDVFQLGPATGREAAWAWPPQREPCRYWHAAVAGRELLYPAEATNLGAIGHDGVFQQGHFRQQCQAAPSDTLVMACCDPAVGILAGELSRATGFRLLALQRSSQDALSLLAQGLIHVAGIHLAGAGRVDQNAAAAKQRLQTGFNLLRAARWQEGLAVAPTLRLSCVRAALQAKVRWVGREAGSAARALLDELLSDRRPPRHIALGHRGVAEAIRCGWADIGVCLRLVGEEAGLDFLPVREEEYDLCYTVESEGDPRVQALIEAVRSPAYRGLIGELPGYDSTETGELERFA